MEAIFDNRRGFNDKIGTQGNAFRGASGVLVQCGWRGCAQIFAQ